VRQVIDVSASQGHIVPTSIVALHHVLCVGNLNPFPIDPQWSKVMTITKDIFLPNPLPGFDGPSNNYARWKIVSSKAGFTTIAGMKIGPDGLLYVLELSDGPGYPTPGWGKVVRVKRSGRDRGGCDRADRADGDDARTRQPAVRVEPGGCTRGGGSDPAHPPDAVALTAEPAPRATILLGLGAG